mmetsp:Transcript_8527/g.13796  ORF Transcript_8527/g.13796 Transcript_8527/m.13796 type:complete len:307 (+) Transcript_8527:54-974(+)
MYHHHNIITSSSCALVKRQLLCSCWSKNRPAASCHPAKHASHSPPNDNSRYVSNSVLLLLLLRLGQSVDEVAQAEALVAGEAVGVAQGVVRAVRQQPLRQRVEAVPEGIMQDSLAIDILLVHLCPPPQSKLDNSLVVVLGGQQQQRVPRVVLVVDGHLPVGRVERALHFLRLVVPHPGPQLREVLRQLLLLQGHGVEPAVAGLVLLLDEPRVEGAPGGLLRLHQPQGRRLHFCSCNTSLPFLDPKEGGDELIRERFLASRPRVVANSKPVREGSPGLDAADCLGSGKVGDLGQIVRMLLSYVCVLY